MSSESLSQDGIDLLFNGGGASTDSAPAEDGPEAQYYDFRRPVRISKERKRSLAAMYGVLAKSLEGWITGRIRDQVTVEVESVEQLSFGEFTLALPSPCTSFVLTLGAQGDAQGVLEIGQELAYLLVDRFLGGAGDSIVLDRPLTPIERMVVRLAADRVVSQLDEIWRDYVQLDLAITGFESIPEMLQVAAREDPVLVANLRVNAAGVDSVILLCLPFTALETFFNGGSERRSALIRGTATERRLERQALEGYVRGATVLVQARLPGFTLPVHTLSRLQPGMILHSGLSPDSHLEVLVAGQPRFIGASGRVGRSLAVELKSTIESNTDRPNRPR
jgi:flagellar motor switch protein FliM